MKQQQAIVHLGRRDLSALLDRAPLVDELFRAFAQRPANPLRQRLDASGGRELLVMPAVSDGYAGIKTLTVMPANAERGRPVISGLFTLFDFGTGAPLATFDAGELTARRTAAVSAAAASRLARGDASRLLMLGAGHLVPYLAAAHAAVRPVARIEVWARNRDRAHEAAARIRALRPDLDVAVATELEAAVRAADIVSVATRATAPVLRGRWLPPGAHVDLVGGYRPDMREIDDDGIANCRLFADARDAALSEAGDLIDPIARGVIRASSLLGDLSDLATGACGRTSGGEITLFKSVGTAAADLATAVCAWKRRAALARIPEDPVPVGAVRATAE